MKTEKFLAFNGKTIFFHAIDGQFWIAIKPICEVLNVNYNRAYQNLNDDHFLGSAFATQQMQVQSENGIIQGRDMVCLPEKYIYGWIFSLQSQSKELQAYKKQCYDILYNFFHGTITGRKDLLQEKCTTAQEMRQLQNELAEDENFLKYERLKKQMANINKALKDNDDAVIEELPTLFNYENN